MINNRAFKAFFLICFLFISASAQTDAAAEKRAAVREFYKLINTDSKELDLLKLIETQAEETGKMLVVLVSSDYQSLDAEQVKTLQDIVSKNQTEIVKRLREKVAAKYNLDTYVDETFENFYDEYFTLDEIKSVIVFYKSTAGAKMRQMNQALNARLKEKLIGNFLPEVWKADEQIKPDLKQVIAAEFSEAILKMKNPPLKKQ